MDESGNEVKNFYMELQKKISDSRDNRGKRHILVFVIFSFFIAILRSPGKLNYSLIQRNMVRDHVYFQNILLEVKVLPISYSQLKRILKIIDYEEFNLITQKYFNKQIIQDNLLWSAIDGKELRGTIDKAAGEKRSENIVQQVSHQNKESQLIGFYNGSKESEKTIVQNHFETEKDLQGKAYSFDALHTSTNLLDSIEQKNGIYLAQVKENQKFLLEECEHIHNNLESIYPVSTSEKGHGRIEQRQGFLYTLNVECLNKRWEKSNIQTLLVIERNRLVTKTEVETNETAFFVSNEKLTKETGLELFNAARRHWTIETDNNIRDVNFGEDEIRCFNKNTSRMMAVSISLALNLLRRRNINNNIRILREELSCNINLLNSYFAIN